MNGISSAIHLNIRNQEDEDNVIEKLTSDEAAKHLTQNLCGRTNLDDSFYICDLGRVAKLYEKWDELLPRVQPFYAVKSAPYGPLIGCLAALGCGFDCASQEELVFITQYGISPDLIIFSQPAKQKSHILSAKELGVRITVFDNEEEMIKTQKLFPSADMLLRIVTDDSNSGIGFSDRFGASMEHSKYLLKRARDLGVSVIGISFHVGTACSDPVPYQRAIKDSRKLFDFAVSLGMEFSVLDIGGGFIGTGDSITAVGRAIAKSLDHHFPEESFPTLRIISEPGRYFASSPFTLATSVISKSVPFESSDVNVEYTLNEGKFGGFPSDKGRPVDEFKPCVLQPSTRKSLVSKIWGPTCTSTDLILPKHSMPEMMVEEWLFWRNAGAYSFSMASKFNGLGARKIYCIISAEYADIFRRRSCGIL